MSVTVDREPLPVTELGLSTVGQVLAHLQKDKRLVVQVLIDGQKPPFEQVGMLRDTQIAGHAIFIETADPRLLAIEVIDESARQFADAERFKTEAADLLQRNQTGKAMEQLGACVRIWQTAQESVTKIAELLRIDLDRVNVGDRALKAMFEAFSTQLRQIKQALEQRDFVGLGDVLLYETAQTTADWLACMQAMRQVVEGIR